MKKLPIAQCFLLAATAASFAGCVDHSSSWTPVAGAGPILYDQVKAPAVQRCEQRLMDGAAQCEVAFEDSTGRKNEVFKTLVPQLIQSLRSQGAHEIVVVVGGVIPASDYEFLHDAGVAAVFGPGSNIPAAASEILALVRRQNPAA